MSFLNLLKANQEKDVYEKWFFLGVHGKLVNDLIPVFFKSLDKIQRKLSELGCRQTGKMRGLQFHLNRLLFSMKL